MSVALKSILLDFIEVEECLDLYKYKYKGLPIWRLFRFQSRNKVLKNKIPEYTNKSLKVNRIKVCFHLLKRIFISFLNVMKLFFLHKSVDNIIFAFPRLQNIGEFYLDKFTDPVIDYSNIADSCIVFQTTGTSIYKGKRWRKDRIVNIDFIYLIAYLGAYLYFPIHYFTSNRLSINLLFKTAKSYFLLTRFDCFKWHLQFCRFIIQKKQYEFLFKYLSVKRIFVVDREIFQAPIYVAHMLNITSYEFQHGVTHDVTPLYSGKFSKFVDPNYFLTFGEKWIGHQFSIPINQMINIGWAYKEFINEYMQDYRMKINAILFISSPRITQKIINCIIELANMYPQYEYHIRCHPQERISDKLIASIALYDNIYITDNSVDSYVALSSYKHIVGENSTVLYEALSLGKNVARLSYGGFSPSGMDNFVDDNFYYLKSVSDFEDFLKNENMNYVDENGIYSPFDANRINNLI